MSGALEDTVVLDLTHVLAGPFCTYQLALLGAQVIKVEPPDAPDCARGRGPDGMANAQGLGLNYQVQGGNKRALALDLKDPRGRDILLRMVRQADVLVENYATGAMDALGLGYEVLKQVHPGLIHCSITGFGDSGPEAGTLAYDNVIQATSGIMAQCGGVKAGVSFVDYATGYAAAFAITSALVLKSRTGEGNHISVSMLEVAMQTMAPEVAAAQQPPMTQKRNEIGIGCYDTADGRLMIGAFRPTQYGKLAAMFAALGHVLPGLEDISDWNDVWSMGEDTRDSLATVLRTRPAQEWRSLFHAADLPAEVVRPLRDAVTDPQLAARGYFQPNPDMPGVSLPTAGFSMTTGGARLHAAPPRVGEHTTDILQDLGLDPSEISSLRAGGVVV